MCSSAFVFSVVTSFTFVLCCFLLPQPVYPCIRLNNRPIIGILAQENQERDPHPLGISYIAASYVKHLEAAGARLVPVRINRTEDEYEKLFNSINGLLLPGGEVDIERSQFARAAKIFYDLAIKANDESDYFPIWGTCLGFEQLTVLTSGKNILTVTKTEGVALPLTFTQAAKESRLFKTFPKDLLQALSTENITANYHDWSLSLQTSKMLDPVDIDEVKCIKFPGSCTFETYIVKACARQNYTNNNKLQSFYKILSTNTDGHTEFISTMEAYKYPFYAVQWHPERNAFEWVQKTGMAHSPSAVKASFYTADFFVNEARRNFHHFATKTEEEDALIYNYCPAYKGQDVAFLQKYYFD